jgi:hypothetical protein
VTSGGAAVLACFVRALSGGAAQPGTGVAEFAPGHGGMNRGMQRRPDDQTRTSVRFGIASHGGFVGWR